MTSFPAAELCDANPSLLSKGELRVLPPIFQIYGQRRAFSGPMVTFKVFEDNVLVREVLGNPGDGRVLVVDGAGSRRRAFSWRKPGTVGPQYGLGWYILVNGCIRDVDEINGCDVLKSNKKGLGEQHGAVDIGGMMIREGEWLYADSDGILISKTELSV